MSERKPKSKRTPDEELAYERAMQRQYATALLGAGTLLSTALAVDHVQLLDWPQMLRYVGDAGEAAMEPFWGEEEAKKARRGER